MVGGYFELPSSGSRRSSTPDTGKSAPRTSSVSHQSSFLASSDSLPVPWAYQECRVAEAEARGKQWNAGAQKPANRVKFTLDELESEDRFGGSSDKTRLDPNGTALPRRPWPAASIPASQEKGPVNIIPEPSVEEGALRSAGASIDVTGLMIHPQSSSPGNEISVCSDDQEQAVACEDNTQKLASLLSRPQKSPRLSPRVSPAPSITSASTEVVHTAEYGDEIPMISLPEKQQPSGSTNENATPTDNGRFTPRTSEASNLIHQMSRPDFSFFTRVRAPSPGPLSGRVTPVEERDQERRTSSDHPITVVLYDRRSSGSLFSSQRRGRYGSTSEESSSEFSGRSLSSDTCKPNRPRKWYDKSPSRSSTTLTGTTITGSSSSSTRRTSSPFAMLKRSKSSGAVGQVSRPWKRPHLEDEIRITIHIAELLSRQRYLIRLCRALMKYGAPTHRLEEYMRMTARVLEIDGQFLYIPGCMIISFDDASTHTTEVKVVRSTQGVDLSRLADVHEIYKEVIHDVIGVEEAIQRLDEIAKRPDKLHILFRILAHGCASACVGPFAFQARPIDMPIAFLLGCMLGILQLILSPKSSLYSNVFEISAAVLTSFLARAFGSIKFAGEPLFCFSALAQSSIALILPGYTSGSIIAGSVRMVYAIIYSLFLGFGITIGTAVYGLLDSQATTAYTCPASPITNEYLQRFPFVLLFTVCLALVNLAKWKQIPVMLCISLAGYAVTYFSSKRFYSNTQVSNALGAFVIGIMGNFYSRIRHGLAAAAMLPAIWVLVPSGLAASGSLISGITSAEEMTQSPYSVVSNGTQGFADAAKNMTSPENRTQSYGVVFDIGYGMVQIAIGTTVGLFLAALIVYPPRQEAQWTLQLLI
ncbi:hypothetical protein N7468_009375 [Penicillium chermesinum]|uniref:Threonine/serine exporter-like N-terminal domain-containing protein n=1 Tax=Penicillium chermesinum TaxID=63820 RepID=A0A9W9NHP8_9EURO|nr:uncharacterized protein N7468_009375 [Penicillium chermesinum]KAJ5220171.1 hypothetical protein N7468_009375 [Penicillium chermesinum]